MTNTGGTRNTGHVELARAQQERWQRAYARHPHLHGTEPSAAARWAAGAFGAVGIDDVLELGAGQGRDALFFAQRGFSMHATDGFAGRYFDETLIRKLADRWRLDDLTPYDEGRRRMCRVALAKPNAAS